jgi:hypothetical protein
MAKQTIDGDNNVQVGKVEGDIHVERSTPIINPSDPDVVACPFKCGQLTWWNAPKCWNCGRPVFQHFEHQRRSLRKKMLKRRGKILVLLGLVIIVVGNYLPNSIGDVAMWFGVFSLLGAYVQYKAAEQL